MALRLRVILPYTIPGVLALLGWWWFFSRKKDDSHSKHKRVTAPTDLQANSALTELGPTLEIQCGIEDRVASTPQGRCFVPPVALIDVRSDCAENILSGDSDVQDIILDSLEQSSVECDIELCLVDADKVCTTSTEYFQSIPSEQLHVVPSTEDGEHTCIDELETVVKMSVLLQCPQSVADEAILSMGEMGNNSAQFPRFYPPELRSESKPLKPDQLSPSLALMGCDLRIEPVTSETAESRSTDPLSNVKSACTEVISEGNCADILDAFSQCLEKSEQFEEGSAKTFFGNYEATIVEQLAINIISKVIVAAKQEILASSASDVSDGYCQVLDEADGEMLPKDDECQQLTLDRNQINVHVVRESCAEMDSTCESTQTEHPQVENIRCTAIVKEMDFIQELTHMVQSHEENIRTHTALDNEMDSACESSQTEHPQGETIQNTALVKEVDFILESTQIDQPHEEKIRNPAALDKEMDCDMDSTCESTQTEESLVETLITISIGTKDSCPEKTDEQIVSNKSMQQTYVTPNFSPVHKNADFLDESQATMEDSSVSVCTSEDGISMEDQLQSTALSSVGVGSYDSLSTSGIELSRETFKVSSEKIKKTVENSVPYSNGDVKRSSLDLKNEGAWTGDTEVDHSGGSDVNSMDSVDSGFALGKTEVQNVKQKMEVKKAELVIWEIEVPKHLVGRLIGKQGRYVSFLKESSGAKIYISTLPYTQDFQICHIEGSQQQVDRALSLIGKKFKELNLTNIYAPPPSLALHSLPMTSWLMLPDGVTVEVIVVNVVNAGHMFVQQHTHPTFHALRGLDQQMYLCYSQPGVPTLPTPVEVGVICAAPAGDNAWWRAQVVAYYKDSEEVEIRYVDYGGYERVKIEILRQIRSDFVTLPFQGAEVLLDNVIPLADEDHFSAEADTTANEMTRGTALLAQVTNYDGATGLPLVQLWSMMADEVMSINRTLVERGFAQWIDNY